MLDEQLIEEYKLTHNPEVISILFKKYQHLVLGVCLKYLKNSNDAADACMEIFEKMHLDLTKHQINFFKAWLHKVACNYCLMKLRKVNINIEYKENVEQEFDNDYQYATLQTMENKEADYLKLEWCIEKLKENQKRCIYLFYTMELSYKEIVLDTGWTFNEVKTHVQNGKLNLKKCVQTR